MGTLHSGFFSDVALANTSDIQALINAGSYSNDYIVELPPGDIVINRLFFFYHPTINPGFNPNSRAGFFTLRGKGQLDISSGIQNNYNKGTVLRSIYSGQGGAVVIASAEHGHDIGPYPSRKFVLEDITLVANNTGYVLEADGCPEIRLTRSTMIQKHVDGSGLLIRSAWQGVVDQCTIRQVGGNNCTGVGISLGTNIQAGAFEIIGGTTVGNFNVNIKWVGQTRFSNMWLNNIIVTHSYRAGLEIEGRLLSLVISGHFEKNPQDILVTGEVNNLNINNLYLLGGNPNEVSSLSRIDLVGGVSSCNISHIYCFRPSSNLIRLASIAGVGCSAEIAHINYETDSISSLKKTITAITEHQSGEIVLEDVGHGLEIGRRIAMKSSDVTGEWPVAVVDANTLRLVGSTYAGPYNTLGEYILLCHVVECLDTTVVPQMTDITFSGGAADLLTTSAYRLIDTTIQKRYNYTSHKTPVMTYGSAIPNWTGALGDIQYDTNPTTSIGWVYSGGTWKVFGAITQ